MSEFSGTVREFKRYIGPHLRNLVQQITRQRRRAVGTCEHCGAANNLEAAHIRGRDRVDIINALLGSSDPNKAVTVDLVEFERSFKCEHTPPQKAILVLCSACHRKYDTLLAQPAAAESKVSPANAAPQMIQSPHEVLPIFLSPPDPAEFKAKLLKHRRATIEALYADGSTERKPWVATRISESSNLFNNIRSKPEFRKGGLEGCRNRPNPRSNR